LMNMQLMRAEFLVKLRTPVKVRGDGAAASRRRQRRSTSSVRGV
jgi:hypothetical protein